MFSAAWWESINSTNGMSGKEVYMPLSIPALSRAQEALITMHINNTSAHEDPIEDNVIEAMYNLEETDIEDLIKIIGAAENYVD